MSPSTHRQWKLTGRGDYDKLKVEQDQPQPKLGDHDILVQVKAASLNFRDIAIVRGTYPFPLKDTFIPLSDASGIVAATGSRVTRFKVGEGVTPTFHQFHLPGTPSLGGPTDGVGAEYIVVSELDAVRLPKGFDHVQGSTLPCAAVTAWNALFGLSGRQLKPGDWVLTQGTGGVSLFALQFAKAAGAYVVATTSSSDKATKLKELGADHVINYKDTPEWGEPAKALTTNGEGFHHIVEIGGPGTLDQTVKAIKHVDSDGLEGVISIIGFVAGGEGKMPTMLDCLSNQCIARGIFVGTRKMHEDMVVAIEAGGLKPIVDDKVFGFDDLPKALEHMEGQNHIGKVVVKFD